VLAYCEHVAGDGHATIAAAEAFRRFRATVVQAADLSDLNPEALLLGATRTAAAEHVPQPPNPPDALRRVARRPATGWCGDVPILLAARANRTISRIDLARLEQHLSGCPACRAPEARFNAAERAYRDPPNVIMPLPATAAIIAALATAAPIRAVAAPPPSLNGPLEPAPVEPAAAFPEPAAAPPEPPVAPPEPPAAPAFAIQPPPEPRPAPEPVVAAPAAPAPAEPAIAAAPPAAQTAPPEPRIARAPPPQPPPVPEPPLAVELPPPAPPEPYVPAPAAAEAPQAAPAALAASSGVIDPHEGEHTTEYRSADLLGVGYAPVESARSPGRRRRMSLPSVSLPSVSLPSVSLPSISLPTLPSRRPRPARGRERVSTMPRAQRAAAPTAHASSPTTAGRRPAALVPAVLVALAVVIAMAFAGIFGGGGDAAKPTSVSPTPTPTTTSGKNKGPDVIVVPGTGASAADVEAAKARARARAKRAARRQRGSSAPATRQPAAPAADRSASPTQQGDASSPPPPPPPASPQVNGDADAGGDEAPPQDSSPLSDLPPAP